MSRTPCRSWRESSANSTWSRSETASFISARTRSNCVLTWLPRTSASAWRSSPGRTPTSLETTYPSDAIRTQSSSFMAPAKTRKYARLFSSPRITCRTIWRARPTRQRPSPPKKSSRSQHETFCGARSTRTGRDPSPPPPLRCRSDRLGPRHRCHFSRRGDAGRRPHPRAQQVVGGIIVLFGWAALTLAIHRFGRQRGAGEHGSWPKRRADRSGRRQVLLSRSGDGRELYPLPRARCEERRCPCPARASGPAGRPSRSRGR